MDLEKMYDNIKTREDHDKFNQALEEYCKSVEDIKNRFIELNNDPNSTNEDVKRIFADFSLLNMGCDDKKN